MKIIITEEQNEQLNKKIRSAVEKLGLEEGRRMFGDELIKQAFIDNPSLFFEQFNSLKPIEKGDKVYYVDNDNLTLFFYYKKDQELKNGYYYISYYRIWAFFEEVMGYNPIKIKGVMKEWLDTIYKLTELKPRGKSYIDFDPGWEQPII
jgi:hypothetical protein